MHATDDLIPYNQNAIDNLLNKLENFYIDNGLAVPVSPSEFANSETTKNISSYLDGFIIPQDKKAFYLGINSKSDIEDKYNYLYSKIEDLKNDIDDYSINNKESLSEDMYGKIKKFKMAVEKVLSPLQSRHKKLLRACDNECNSIDEMQERAGDTYESLLKEKLFPMVVPPLYEGLRNSNDSSYKWLLKKMNSFFSEIGIYTVPLNVGNILSDEDIVCYQLQTKNDESDVTSDATLNCAVREIEYYAYRLSEDGEPRIVMEGKVNLWRIK